MTTDPKMPETAAWIGTGHLREVCAGNDMNVYLSSERDRFTDIALVVREEALASAEALAAQRVAQERERCARLCDDLEAAIWREYKDSTGASSHTEGRSDGAGECAAAIRQQPPETGKEG